MADLARTIFDRFERLLRWIYPGLLFWAVLPFAWTPPLTGLETLPYASFYGNVPDMAQIGLIVTVGSLVYLLERYIVSDLIIWLLYILGVGAAVNFAGANHRWWNRLPWCGQGFGRALGQELWVRFGQRPSESEKNDTVVAEGRFDTYMMSRWASVHALCETWMVAIALMLISHEDSLLANLPQDFNRWYWPSVLALVIGWVYAVWLTQRAEQAHYKLHVQT